MKALPIIAFLLVGACTPQPRAINTGPFLVVPCVFLCNTELAIEAAEDNTGSVTGGAQNQSIDTGKADLSEGSQEAQVDANL